MTRSRAADDFATIRARLRQLQRERGHTSRSRPDVASEEAQPPSELETRSKERREGAPPPWVPTMFG